MIDKCSVRFPVGQNLAMETTTGPSRPANWKKMITKWFEEVEAFPSTDIVSYKSVCHFFFFPVHSRTLIHLRSITNHFRSQFQASVLSKYQITLLIQLNLYDMVVWMLIVHMKSISIGNLLAAVASSQIDILINASKDT